MGVINQAAKLNDNYLGKSVGYLHTFTRDY